MKKSFIKQWLRAFALMALMLTTSMVASAADRYYLRGGLTDDDPGWSSNDHPFRTRPDMPGKVYGEFTAPSGFEFKLVYIADGTDEEVWIGSNNGGYAHVANEIPYTFTSVKPNEGENMIIGREGTYRFIYDITNEELQLEYIPCPVEIFYEGHFEGGSITLNKTKAVQGETVTLTVTPDYGYVCNKDNITIELTIEADIAQAPRRAPQVGDKIQLEGDAQATHDAPATYTFTMPEYPYGVVLSAAEFQEIPKHKISLVNDQAHCTVATDQTDNDAVFEGALVTVTPTATPAEDFVATGLDIFISGQGVLEPADIDVTANGDGSFSFVMPEYDILVSPQFKAYLHGVVLDPGRNHWATYFGAYNLYVPEGVTAYVVTGVENDEVTVEQTDIIPMNTGVLLYAEHLEEPMFDITTDYINEIVAGGNSLLRGYADTEVSIMGYVLYEDKFILSNVRGALPAHRCYLPMASVPAGAPRVLKIVRPGEGGVVTGVESINTSDVVSVKYVNLSGMTSDRADGTTETIKMVK